jgi:hypothetical protein
MKFLYRRTSLPLENLCLTEALKRRRRTAALRRAISVARRTTGVQPMLDILLLALGLGLFVISVGYAYACDRL